MRHRPDGVEEALRLAHEVEEAQLRVREKAAAIVAIEGSLVHEKAALARLEAAVAAKRKTFEQLIRSGACTADCHDPAHVHVDPATNQPVTDDEPAADDELLIDAPDLPAGVPADWNDLALRWRLAWLIFLTGEVKYEAAALQIYGDGSKWAQGKINALISDLRANGIVEKAQGVRHYRVKLTRAQLVNQSGSNGSKGGS